MRTRHSMAVHKLDHESSIEPDLLYERVKQWFIDDDWPFEEHHPNLTTAFHSKNGEWQCVAEIGAAAGIVAFYSLLPFVAPTNHRLAAMEAITRANYGLTIGAFDLDLETGKAQFRTSIDVEDEIPALTDGVLHHLIYQNVVTTDRYLPALRAVCEEGSLPAPAIAAVEALE